MVIGLLGGGLNLVWGGHRCAGCGRTRPRIIIKSGRGWDKEPGRGWAKNQDAAWPKNQAAAGTKNQTGSNQTGRQGGGRPPETSQPKCETAHAGAGGRAKPQPRRRTERLRNLFKKFVVLPAL